MPRGVVVNEPLHMLSVLGDGAADISHALVVLEEGAEATLLCETDGIHETDAGLHCGALEIMLRPGAHLRVVNLQNWGHGTWHFAHQKAVVERDASLQWTVAAMGSRAGEGQPARGVGRRRRQLPGERRDVHRRQTAHRLPHAAAPRGAQLPQRFPLQGGAAGQVADRLARHDQGGPRRATDRTATSGTTICCSVPTCGPIRFPGLEIEADNVRCTHGSTTGRVDEELIFYAQCRGFTRQEAIEAIVSGFFQQIFDRITIESVREALGLAIGRRVRDYA